MAGERPEVASQDVCHRRLPTYPPTGRQSVPTVGFMTGPSESVTKPPTTRVANRGNQDRMVLARQRDLKALELRLAGCTFQQMAEQMGFNDHSQAYRV